MHLSTRSAIRWRLRRRLWDVRMLRQLNIDSAGTLTKHFGQICRSQLTILFCSPFANEQCLDLSLFLVRIVA